MSEEVKVEEEVVQEAKVEATQDTKEQEQLSSNLQQLLSTFDGAPDQAQINAWKKQYREVFVSGFSDTEVYLWRPITRPEYISVQKRYRNPILLSTNIN